MEIMAATYLGFPVNLPNCKARPSSSEDISNYREMANQFAKWSVLRERQSLKGGRFSESFFRCQTTTDVVINDSVSHRM
jgi:hypothetical protein